MQTSPGTFQSLTSRHLASSKVITASYAEPFSFSKTIYYRIPLVWPRSWRWNFEKAIYTVFTVCLSAQRHTHIQTHTCTHRDAGSRGGVTHSQDGDVLGPVQPPDRRLGLADPPHHGHIMFPVENITIRIIVLPNILFICSYSVFIYIYWFLCVFQRMINECKIIFFRWPADIKLLFRKKTIYIYIYIKKALLIYGAGFFR